MKKLLQCLVLLLMSTPLLQSQNSWLQPEPGFKTGDFPGEFSGFSCFDIQEDLLYAFDEDTVRIFNLDSQEQLSRFTKPADYPSWPVFLHYDSVSDQLWAGFSTSGNADDRIYHYSFDTETWTLAANFAANYDLNVVNGHILISGSNSDDWGMPNGIFLLDTTGTNNHRMIIEVGGSPAGFAVDHAGNVFAATASFSQPNALYKWPAQEVEEIINNPEAEPLTTADAEKLSDIPAATSDTHMDEAGNVFFNFNSFTQGKTVAYWNGTYGDGDNFISMALTEEEADWLTYIKTRGSVLTPEEGNELYALGFGRPLARVTRGLPPAIAHSPETVMVYENDAAMIIDLSAIFEHPEGDELIFQLVFNAFEEVAQVTLEDELLTLEFLSPGQTHLIVSATANEQTVELQWVVGVMPLLEGDYQVAHFEELPLDPESYWNGSDESGGFVSEGIFFPNDYNPEWGAWTGWAYSNVSDNTTPGWLNQYSAITGTGVDPESSGGTNYAVAFQPQTLKMESEQPYLAKGFFITNTTYAGLAMMYGDDFSKKFGGVEGNDPDWFRISVWGFTNGEKTDSIHYYLSDYRFEDNRKNYVIQTWQWLELSSLGVVDSLGFALSSSDVGDWGMNTPAFFAIDNVHVQPQETTVREVSLEPVATAFPNPATHGFRIGIPGHQTSVELTLFNSTGQLVYQNPSYIPGEYLNPGSLPGGIYVAQIRSAELKTSIRIVIR